jgi:hypothetical protein
MSADSPLTGTCRALRVWCNEEFRGRIMRSRFLYIALAILVARKLLLSRNVMTKASKMLPTKQGPRATLVRHPSARRRLIKSSRRKSSKTRLRGQKIALAQMGRLRHFLPPSIVKRDGPREPPHARLRIALFELRPEMTPGWRAGRRPPSCAILNRRLRTSARRLST